MTGLRHGKFLVVGLGGQGSAGDVDPPRHPRWPYGDDSATHPSVRRLIGQRLESGLASSRKPWHDPGMNLLDRITIEPDKCGGRPCIRGMRVRVKDVLEMLADGATQDEILADFPYLEVDDIRASLLFAAAQNGHAILGAPMAVATSG